MSKPLEKRRASRIHVSLPTVVESVGQSAMKLHPSLDAVYDRVRATADSTGDKHPCTIRDLSTNGAFLTGPPLPLLSRVAFVFRLEEYGEIEALGWTMWRRTDDCSIPGKEGEIRLAKGFGVLFEAIPLDARIAIHRIVQSARRN